MNKNKIDSNYLSYVAIGIFETIARSETYQLKAITPKTVFNQWRHSKNINYSNDYIKSIEIGIGMLSFISLFTFLAMVIDNKVSSAAFVKGYIMAMHFMLFYDNNYWLREMLNDLTKLKEVRCLDIKL
ncbi:hypothetical protein [Dielma fastidiosa]|uniref:hypothetical protein n=1 Tax=Dielma fastidiosa TaxID=1034346 RepID=UPI00356AE765